MSYDEDEYQESWDEDELEEKPVPEPTPEERENYWRVRLYKMQQVEEELKEKLATQTYVTQQVERKYVKAQRDVESQKHFVQTLRQGRTIGQSILELSFPDASSENAHEEREMWLAFPKTPTRRPYSPIHPEHLESYQYQLWEDGQVLLCQQRVDRPCTMYVLAFPLTFEQEYALSKAMLTGKILYFSLVRTAHKETQPSFTGVLRRGLQAQEYKVQHYGTGLWYMVYVNGNGTARPVGLCNAGAIYKDESWSKGWNERTTPALLPSLADTCTGHATAQEAADHYAEYLIRTLRHRKGFSTTGIETLEACVLCGKLTTEGVEVTSVDGPVSLHLCSTHNTPNIVTNHLKLHVTPDGQVFFDVKPLKKKHTVSASEEKEQE